MADLVPDRRFLLPLKFSYYRKYLLPYPPHRQAAKTLVAIVKARDKNMMTYLQNRKVAFYIALAYVGFGTLCVCSIYPFDYFYGEWTLFGLVITFPVTIISFGYRYANSELLYPVFIIQLMMLVLTFVILGTVVKKKKRI